MHQIAVVVFSLLYLLRSDPLRSEERELRVAVASNFAPTLTVLKEAFEDANGVRLVVISSSSGKLYLQIKQGAPYDVFLSADKDYPQRLAMDGFGRELFPYASGRLALWLPWVALRGPEVLRDPTHTLAIANPETAPYGRASVEVLRHIGIDKSAQRVLRAESISQVFFYTRNQRNIVGMVAYSFAVDQKLSEKEYWIIPESYHSPILQFGLILSRSSKAGLARLFRDYLLASQKQLQKMGYQPVPSQER